MGAGERGRDPAERTDQQQEPESPKTRQEPKSREDAVDHSRCRSHALNSSQLANLPSLVQVGEPLADGLLGELDLESILGHGDVEGG